MNEGKTSTRSKVARLAALGTAVALLGVSLGVYIPAANAQTGGGTGGKMGKMATGKKTSKAHKGGKKSHKGGKKGKKGSMGTMTTPPPK